MKKSMEVVLRKKIFNIHGLKNKIKKYKIRNSISNMLNKLNKLNKFKKRGWERNNRIILY